MNIRDLLDKWGERRKELARLNASVSADALLADVLTDLEAAEQDLTAATGSLTQAAEYSGLHADSISRRIRKGQLKNHGTKARPRVRFSDLAPKAPPKGEAVTVASISKQSHSSGAATVGALALDISASRRK